MIRQVFQKGDGSVKRVVRRTAMGLAIGITGVVLAAVGYGVYVLTDYHRIADRQVLEIDRNPEATLKIGETYRLATWNIGFGAYSDDYSFFMDGGTESRAFSRAAVLENTAGVQTTLTALKPDFLLLQEVDVDSTRSYHVDQRALLENAFPTLGAVFACNYDSSYLFYPFREPIGKSYSGLLTLSSRQMGESVRRSLPIESGFRKFLDLDRCYTVTKLPVDNGKNLCLVNLHLSAYTADGSIVAKQLQMLTEEMSQEIANGNYVICGGDFNMDLLGNSAEVFGVAGDYAWAKAFPQDQLPEGLTLVTGVDLQAPVASCRNCDTPYVPGETFVAAMDGFLVSDQVTVERAWVEDTGFAHTDHQPVILQFCLSE
jgi:endonuclease/exonuclease/phosphatase family metal-dependent hydrolase